MFSRADLLRTALVHQPLPARHSLPPYRSPHLKMSKRVTVFPFDASIHRQMKPEHFCANCKAQGRICYYLPGEKKDLACIPCAHKRMSGCDQSRGTPSYKPDRESSLGLRWLAPGGWCRWLTPGGGSFSLQARLLAGAPRPRPSRAKSARASRGRRRRGASPLARPLPVRHPLSLVW